MQRASSLAHARLSRLEIDLGAPKYTQLLHMDDSQINHPSQQAHDTWVLGSNQV